MNTNKVVNQWEDSWKKPYGGDGDEDEVEQDEKVFDNNKGRHLMFAFEMLFLVDNFESEMQKKKINSLQSFSSHERKLQKTNKFQSKSSGESLYSCLDQFRQEEKLGQEDSWYCSTCKEHVEATKKLELYSVAPILVLCLNRFKQHNVYFKEKMEDMINCPLNGLDLSPYVLSHSAEKEPLIYDLVAVTNHYGSMNFGHYTAFGKNDVTQRWHEFNDSSVNVVTDESDVISGASYVLFYKRRDFNPTKMQSNPKFIDFAFLKKKPVLDEPLKTPEITASQKSEDKVQENEMVDE